jgi:LCP family protein required for cell wall assembly
LRDWRSSLKPLAVIKYVVFHPVRVAFAVIAGVLLGVACFYAYQVSVAVAAIATEDFDPEGARDDIGNEDSDERHIVFVEPTDIQDEPLDLVSLQEELAAVYDITRPFDPREFSPYSFGDPIRDELYEAYLLLGTDASGALADAIILALKPTGGGRPIMVSLPRDLYVWNVCKETFTRLNAGLGGCSGFASGPEMMAILVEDYTGIPIDHLARINFSGFASVVNSLGGVTICVDYPTRDSKSHLLIEKPGCQKADGATTLGWVRSRHGQELRNGSWVAAGGSDFERQGRQQDVLFQLAGKASGFSSPASLVNTLSAVTGSVRLDSSWSFSSAVSTAWKYRGISKDSVTRFSIGVRNYRTPGGAQVLLPTKPFASYLP